MVSLVKSEFLGYYEHKQESQEITPHSDQMDWGRRENWPLANSSYAIFLPA